MGAQALTGDRSAASSKLPLLAAAATGVRVGAAIVASRDEAFTWAGVALVAGGLWLATRTAPPRQR